MDKDSQQGRIATFSLGALTALALAVFSVLLRRWQRPPAESPVASNADVLPPSTPAPQAVTRLSTGAPVVIPANPNLPLATPRWTTPTKYIVSVILFLAALLVIIIGRGAIPLVITGALLALFINPFILLLNRWLRGRWSLAVILTYVLVILVLAAVVLLVIPNLINALQFIFSIDFQQLAADTAQNIAQTREMLANNQLMGSTVGPVLDVLQTNLEEFAATAQLPGGGGEINLTRLIPQLAGILSPLISLLVSLLFTLLISLQMSLASPQMAGWYPDLIPEGYKPELSELGRTITQTWVSFLRGQMTLMFIIGIATWIVNSILGVPQALFLGVIAGLLELIPSLGPTLAAIPAVLLALLFGSTHFAIEPLPFALIVIAAYALIQFVENQFLVPYIMGDAVDLPPLVVLIGALAGAMAFGILGALLATPVIATGNLVFRYTYRKILEPPPLPPEPEEPPGVWERVKGWAGRIRLPGRGKGAI
jgi:predicted PurR-regulated permease PerM